MQTNQCNHNGQNEESFDLVRIQESLFNCGMASYSFLGVECVVARVERGMNDDANEIVIHVQLSE